MTAYEQFEIAISVAAAVTLFTYALKGFGDDVRRSGGEALDSLLSRVTRGNGSAFLLGVAITAILQSSSAVSGIAVALVEAGVISFRGSLPVFLGANVGTTSTAWLVAFDAKLLGPILVVLSVVLSVLPGKVSLFGRSIFYLGVILLALRLISDSVGGLKDNPQIAQWLAYARYPVVGLATGVVATAVLQSSSVVIGLAVIAVQQGLLSPQDVIPIVLGSNIGTTSTALIASLGMRTVARRAAIANLVFNAVGVALFLPFMDRFGAFVVRLADTGDVAVALSHLLFNLAVAVIGFAILRPLNDILNPARSKAGPDRS